MNNHTINLMSKEQQKMIDMPATKGLIYFGIGMNPESQKWFINSGRTTHKDGIAGRYGRHTVQAFYWYTIELASFAGYTKLNRKIATALRNAQKRVRKGGPVHVEFQEEKARLNIQQGNLITTFEWLAREGLRESKLAWIQNTSTECWGYVDTFEEAKYIVEKVEIILTVAIDYYLEDIAKGKNINKVNARKAYDKAVGIWDG
jgi:hypothetical protein